MTLGASEIGGALMVTLAARHPHAGSVLKPIPRVFSGLGEQALRAVATELTRHSRRVVAGAVVLHDGETFDGVLVVLDGWVASTKCLEDGEAQIIDFALPGDILDPAAGDGRTTGVSIEAVTDARISVVPVAYWQRLVSDYPQVGELVDHASGAARARASERILRLGKGSAQTRIAYTLIELCVRLKAAGETAVCEYHLPLTQRDIGDFVGLSSVHVCRTLRRLERAGMIDVDDHIDVKILDIDALARIAQIDPARLTEEATTAVG